MVAEVAQRLQCRALAFDGDHPRVERRINLRVDEFVDQQFRHDGASDLVEGGAALLPALHTLAVLLPEVGGQFGHAGVEEVAVLQHLVVEVVLGVNVQRAGLDAHVDVFRHQHDVALGQLLLQMQADRDDLVVGLARCE